MIIAHSDGERAVAAREFFQGVMSTALAPDELLREVRLPVLADDARTGFAEFSRRAGDFAMAASLVVLRVARGVISEARIGVGGAEAFARRLEAAEASLIGQPPNAALFEKAASIASASIDPLEDDQTDAACRRELVAAMVGRALKQTMANG
jgi:carbon-monoxide dehydrogenase medium subunit